MFRIISYKIMKITHKNRHIILQSMCSRIINDSFKVAFYKLNIIIYLCIL